MKQTAKQQGSFLEQAIQRGYATESLIRSRRRVTFLAANQSVFLTDSADDNRAEFWAELILRYGYDPERIRLDYEVPGATPNRRADLVVFSDAALTQPFAVVECKASDLTDAEFAQAIEQAASNGIWGSVRATYIGVVAGRTRRFLDYSIQYGDLEREQNIVADFPAEYGKPAEFKYRKGTAFDIAPVSKESLISVLGKSHQTLWGGGRLSPPTAFGELCKLIFVKISDERKPRKTGEPYDFQIRTHEAPTQLASRLRSLYAESRSRDPEVFSEDIKVPDGALRSIVSQLEGIDLSSTELDVKGLAFERFMDSFFKGDFGQYFTPREVVEFIVDLVKPSEEDLVLDPACGSGGFLLQCLDYIRTAGEEFFQPGTKESERQWRRFAEKHLFGIEINDEITRVAKMNMILHDDGHSNIVGADALERFPALQNENSKLKPQSFDLILTNPPFGAQVLASERGYLPGYDLAWSDSKSGDRRLRKGQKTEILFIERIWEFLKPGGRTAIILPDGILTNQSLQYVRDFIIDRFRLLAVISLPSTAFTHYGAGVKASVIFAERRQDGLFPSDDERVFMAQVEEVGYDAVGRATTNDLPKVLAAYEEFAKAATPRG